MMRTSVLRCGDRDAIATRALDLLIDGLRPGIARRGVAHLALTGGSSAAALFPLLRSDPCLPGSHVTGIESAIHAARLPRRHTTRTSGRKRDCQASP